MALTTLAACSDDPDIPSLKESVGETSQPVTHAALVDPAARPWAAFLKLEFINGEDHYCSGSLVGPSQVLTAAHCLVCTEIVAVWLVGETGNELDAYDEASELGEHWHSASLAIQPEAFPAFDRGLCHLPTEDWKPLLDATQLDNVGADLGVVHLASAPWVPHAEVLLMPPHGFSPAQDLFGVDRVGI